MSTLRTATARRLERTIRATGDESGFTLVELLVSMVFLMLLWAAFAAMAGTTANRSASLFNDSILQTRARSSINQFSNDLRQAYAPTSSGTSLASISATALTFYSPDQTYSSGSPANFNLREIGYQISGTALQRRVATSTTAGGIATTTWSFGAWGSWFTTVSGITNPSAVFTYYDDSNPPVQITNYSNVSSVATVDITLTFANPDKGGSPLTFSNSVTLRVAQ